MNESAQLHCSLPTLSADGKFGPLIDECRDDFTITFEQYFLSIVPSVLFLLLAPIRANVLRKRQARVEGQVLRYVKLVAIGVFVILQFTTVLLWTTTDLRSIRTPAAIASSLSFVASLALFGLSHLEHSKSIRPSPLLNAYLFFSFLFDIAVLRTTWLALRDTTLSKIFTASFALKGVVLLLESKEKRQYLRSDSALAPEETTGLYNQTFLIWMNSIINSGYRHILRPVDLYSMDESMSAEVLSDRFWEEWRKASLTSTPSLLKVVSNSTKWTLLAPVIPRIALLAFTFCQPLLLKRFLKFLQDGDENVNVGYGMIAAYALVYFGISISGSLTYHRTSRMFTVVRGMLVGAIYTKTTEINLTSTDNSASVTLMSTDVERIIYGMHGMHEIWANVLQFILATWLLETQMGWACVGPTVTIICAAGLTVSLANLANKFQVAWVQKTEKRIGIISNMLGHMKGIKMLGLSEKMGRLMQQLRVEELQRAQKMWSLLSIYSGFAFMPQALGPVATFAFYAIIAAKDNTAFDPSRVFTSLSLLILFTQPLFAFFQDLITFRTIFGCVGRIEKFLLQETRSDHRLMDSNMTAASFPATAERVGNPDEFELVQMPRRVSKSEVSADVVRIEDASFGWNKEEAPILHDINCTIKRSQLTMLVGPVASGKSTLLKAILGESMSSKGFVYVSETASAYCDQTPWLINASVKDNVIGFSNFNQSFYDEVIHSCNLEQDISTFPNGHDTLVGSKGISLSTGQKQRLAIARAVYSKNDLIIFDDVFSGLDVNTQGNVVSRLIGPDGLLRNREATILVATHAVNLLPLADHVIALSSEGTISEQGTFKELQSKNGYVHRLFTEQQDGAATTTADSERSKLSEASTLPQALGIPGTSEDTRRQTGDWTVYKYYFQTTGKSATMMFFSLSLAWAFFSTFPTVWLKWYSDADTREPNKHTGLYLGVYSALQTVSLIVTCVLTWVTFTVMAKRSGLRLHHKLVDTVMSAPMSFFSKTDIGSITTRFSQDMTLLDSQLPISVSITAGMFFGCTAQIGLIASASYYISIAFPFLFTVYFLVQRYYLRTSRQMRFLDLEEKAPVYTQFIESLSGLATIRAFAWQKPSIAQNHTLVNKSQKPFYLMYMIQTWLVLVMDLITCALAILVVGISVRMRSTVSVGFTGVSLTQIISFTHSLKIAIMQWTNMETSIGAVSRVREFESETLDENLDGENGEVPKEWPSRGGIEVENLTASYSADPSARPALFNLSLSIPPGTKVAIVGRTGSGKSTLLLALSRMIEISSGSISIDGLDISTLPRQAIRSRLNTIGDDKVFLTGSIRFNLDPYEAATDAQILSVLRKLNLADAIEAKGGLDAELKDDMFSHGQVQIFCLARALLRDLKIVVLDEVSSAVDRETDALMQRVVREEFEGKTVVCIAHRMETVLDYDVVVVLGDGKVVEMGTPGELRGRDGSVFKGMVERGL
ncbi:P-loop containing nucleoside triphosphate hydrolase protein [Lophiostoma macrostomum CBS 122681]|uniref:P-loop containing nucleoside triphosphate hydrolase protein n=1 Tax=Lophiostoma macrostomum CBS 122681 TaxID=1314788 RepID=A0A6A6TKR0_9PLEO|nr:P-loop containing nucleoside triphosphate hydrolase protein [Lophiostoma macrostomum CBS 122681]